MVRADRDRDPDHRIGAASASGPGVIGPGRPILLGFDGSMGRDAIALVAFLTDGCLVPLLTKNRPPDARDDWRVGRREVERVVVAPFVRFDVGHLHADPPHQQAEVEGWAERWPGRVVASWTNTSGRTVTAVDRFRTKSQESRVFQPGYEIMMRHALNARLRRADREDRWHGLEKADTGRLIDAAIGAAPAVQAAAQILASPPTTNVLPQAWNLNDPASWQELEGPEALDG